VSHLSTAPRRQAIVVHHRGVCGAETDPADTDCWAWISGNLYNHFYDFCVDRVGNIYESWDTARQSIPFWQMSCGGHAYQANCVATGVMMQRCYGSSQCTCSQPGFNDAQLCALAFLSLHIDMPVNNTFNHISHNKAESWQPCACGSCGESNCAAPTDCCGTNLQTSGTADGWTTEGENEMNRMFWMRSNLLNGFNCLGTCPC
jgi:hypothetical protein